MDGRLRNMTAIYLLKGDKVFLLYRQGGKVVNNVWTGSAGGHFEKEELNDPRACVLRELEEELGLTEWDLCDLKLRYITHRYMAGEIRQNYYYFASLREERELTSTEGTLRWVKPEEFPDLPMPVSAKHMILHYLEAGQYTADLYAGITEQTGTHFVPMREFEG